MALPVPESAAGPRHDIIRLLAQTPEGLSDGEVAAALADRHPTLNAKAVNHQCRKLVAEGAVERVGTRPVRTRVVAMPEESDATDEVPVPDEIPVPDEVPVPDAAPDSEGPDRPAGHTTHPDQPSDVPLDDAGAPTPTLPPVQASIVRALADAPDGLTDTETRRRTRRLATPTSTPRPSTTRPQARQGRPRRAHRTVEGRPDPHAPHRPRRRGAHHAPRAGPRPASTCPWATSRATSRARRAGEAQPAPAVGNGNRNGTAFPSRRPRRRAKTPSDDVARIRRSERDGDDPDEPLLRFLPFAPAGVGADGAAGADGRAGRAAAGPGPQ